jgi:hypothetical protein
VLDDVAAADKEAADKRATKEAAVKRAVEERATEEATVMSAAAEEVASKIMDEAAGAAGGSPAPARRPWRPGPRGLRLQVAPTHRPNVPIGVFGNLSLSNFLSPFFFVWLHSLIPLFAQVLSLRRSHCDRHDWRRCGCRGGS